MGEWKKNKKEEIEIDLWRFVEVLLKRLWIIVLAVCLFAAGGYTYTKLSVKPLYRTQFTAYIKNRVTTEVTSNNANSTNTGDLNASIGMMYLYNEVISSRSVLTSAAADVGLKRSYNGLKNMVSTELPEKAALIKVKVVADDPEVAKTFAAAIANRATERGKAIEDKSSMEVVDYPVETTTIFPIAKNTMLAAVIGGILSYALFVVIDLVNDRVKSGDDLENRYDVVVVGRIPDMAQSGKSYKYKYRYSYRRYGYRKGYGDTK